MPQRRVYPRVCGGNGRGTSRGSLRQGLSPRVRGKPSANMPATASDRSIPACAGETDFPRVGRRVGQVYPRVCGGNMLTSVRRGNEKGLSPRVRGKPELQRTGRLAMWSIPACAGETVPDPARRRSVSVYPRVCGGNPCTAPPILTPTGLSPRVRGKHVAGDSAWSDVGSIPACAGETHTDLRFGSLPTVYPRVCGGNLRRCAHRNVVRGLSPRVRGKPDKGFILLGRIGSIPACAGETIGRPAPPSD